MMRSTMLAAIVALGTLVAVPALAAPAQGDAPAKHQRAEGGRSEKHFPMPAAEFKARIDKRQAKARARMEEKAAQLPADQAKELRASFEASAQKLGSEVSKAVADGTVTKDEAKAVRAASPHHGKHARHGKGGKRK
jgi:hypothetical protein